MDRVAFEVIAEGEVAHHFKEGVVAGGVADVFQVVVLAACAYTFCAVVARLYGRLSKPKNTSLNWFMPALVNSRVGSSCGTRLEERTTVWPLVSKILGILAQFGGFHNFSMSLKCLVMVKQENERRYITANPCF